MDDLIGAVGLRTDQRRWPLTRKIPSVVVVAGIAGSGIVDAALADPALADPALTGPASAGAAGGDVQRTGLLPRFEPDCTPPCDAVLWRLETASGAPLNQPGLLTRHWHRKPYAMTVRLVRYQPRSVVAEVLDEGTVGTRGPWHAFTASVDRLAMRLVRDAALGRARGASGMPPAPLPFGAGGWIDHQRSRWRDRLMTEWWSLGSTETPIETLVAGEKLAPIHWYAPEAGDDYLADPFPWFGTDMMLAEEMPRAGGIGRIVSVARTGDRLSPPVVNVLDDGFHHSYPCTLLDGGVLYCVPESVERGATRIYRLDERGTLTEVCVVAPHARLADPTLFRWFGRYWLACTDLDVGPHDNLCLLHAPSVTGPWTPHALWPVKIDIRGARPAGSPLRHQGRLFRPGQDCAETYGAGVALHEVTRLTETEFAETLITTLRPDPAGPFPHGLHTLNHDGERFWVDGKRFVPDLRLAGQKLKRWSRRRRPLTEAS